MRQGVRIPPRLLDSYDTGENQAGRLLGHIGSPIVEERQMVGHARGAPPGRCPTPWGPQSSAGLLPAPASSGGDGCLPAGVGSALLSQEAQTLISNDIRLSTKRVYESRVKIFQLYCWVLGRDSPT